MTRKYRRKSSKTLYKIEWIVIIAIILYVLLKRLILAIQQLIFNVQYQIQIASITDWFIFLFIIIALIFIIKGLLDLWNVRNTKAQKEAKASRIAEARIRVFKDLEYQKLLLMNPYDFEKYVADLFTLMGYEAELTPRSGDGGKDILLRRGNEQLLVECKKYNEKNKVSRPAIQKFHSAIIDMNAKEGFFVTTGYFTQPAMKYSLNKPIKLVDLPRLIEMIKEAKHNV